MQDQNFVIVGAGQGGRRAAESLRERAPQARICLIGEEPHLPYDRPSLSKETLLDERQEPRIFVRGAEYYASHRIEMRLGAIVTSIDRRSKTLILRDGDRVPYDRLLLATGSRVRTVEWADVHYLRTLDDARRLRARLSRRPRVLVLGGGFIGLEVAASAISSGCSVTLIEPAERLLIRSMPPIVSEYMRRLHVQRGVDVRLGVKVTGICNEKDVVSVETTEGLFQADLVVAGIGVIPNTELARDAGLEVNDGIVVDAQCRTADPDIFAAGEVTRHFVPALERHVRVESWQVAEKQPAVAAANMLGASESYGEVPWLWSDQYDCNLQSLGYFDSATEVVLRGGTSDGAFAVAGLDGRQHLCAAVTVNSGRDMAALMRLASAGPLDARQLADTSLSLRSLIRR